MTNGLKLTLLKSKRALNAATEQLYWIYKAYSKDTKPLPEEAVYEQAIWLPRMDDSIQKAEQGFKQVSVGGIMVSVDVWMKIPRWFGITKVTRQSRGPKQHRCH